MGELIKYRIWCNTENAYVTTEYLESPPTKCPNNNTHEVDLNKIDVSFSYTVPSPTTVDGKPRFQQTPRPLGTKTHFTSIGDDITDSNDIGGGQFFEIVHNIGDPTTQVIYLDFNCLVGINETWIFKGSVTYETAKRDLVVFDMVPKVIEFETSEIATSYREYNGVVLPAAMGVGNYISIPNIINGTILSNHGLVYAPDNDLGQSPTAYWNADWDEATEKFINITPNYTGTGRYNMFTQEKIFVRFINVLLLGSKCLEFGSSDVDHLGHGVRFKITANTRGTDHDWQMIGLLTMFREDTI